jgi:hypothetical protein
MNRQYEKTDCHRPAVEGEVLEIAEARVPANGFGDVDLVGIFGDPKTREIVWVPYKSEVEIEGRTYKVLRGKLGDVGDRLFTRDQSTKCLQDENGNMHEMYKFMHKKVKIKKLNNSKIDNFFQYLFDYRNNKLEPPNTYSFEQLAKYGVLGGWGSGAAQLEKRMHKLIKKFSII